MLSHRWLWLAGLLVLAGCHGYPDYSDSLVESLAQQVRDPELQQGSAAAPHADPAAVQPKPPRKIDFLPAPQEELEPISCQIKGKGGEPLKGGEKKEPLNIPNDFPGSNAPRITWPSTALEQTKALQKLYPELPPLPAPLEPAPGPRGQPLALSELQSLAAANNPSVRAAVAGVQAARGAAIQAGAYPNPSVFWESDTVGTGGTAGYQGGGFGQVIKSASKVKLARAAAVMDFHNAELALRKAESDLATQVRSAYFATLVNRENVKINRALATFTENVYRAQVDLLQSGKASAYEPMQVRPLVSQARINLLQATNQYIASWRQLAAAVGVPGMPLTQLAGSVDLPVPIYHYDELADIVVHRHTDVLTGLNNVQKARYAEELARVNVYPDPELRVLLQKDYTFPPHLMIWTTAVTLPIPVWDQNNGNILQAKSQIVQAVANAQESKLQLLNTLADAFNRYSTAREFVRVTSGQIQDQIQAYRGVYERRGHAPDDVSFGDVVAAQQTLALYLSGYVTALSNQWQAVVDLANLLQTGDLFQTGRTEEMFPVPCLDAWPPWPCPGPVQGPLEGLPASGPNGLASPTPAQSRLGPPGT